MKRLRNIVSALTLLGVIAAAALFTGCGPQCPAGKHMNMLGQCVDSDSPAPPVCGPNQVLENDTCECAAGFVPAEDGAGCKYPDETCDMAPENEDQILVGAVSACDTSLSCEKISYRADGGQPQVVAHDVNGFFTLNLVTCGYYRFDVTCPYGGGTGKNYVTSIEGLAEQYDEGVIYTIPAPDNDCTPPPDDTANDDDDTTDQGGGTDEPAPLFADLAACLAYTASPDVNPTLDYLYCCNVQDFGLLAECADYVVSNP